MAWTTPRTWVNLEVPTSTIFNAHVRDNLNETAPAKVSVKGDIVAATGANAIARVPVAASDGVPFVSQSGCNTGVMAGACTFLTFDFIRVLSSGASAAKFSLATCQNGMSWFFQPNSTSALGIYAGSTAATPLVMLTACGQLLFNTSASNTSASEGTVTFMTSVPRHAFSLKKYGLAHGITNQADTDTFGTLGTNTAAANSDGLSITGLSTEVTAFVVRAMATSTDTAKTAAACAVINLRGFLKNGTGASSLGGNQNLVTLQNNACTVFIFDADGDFHADAAATASAYDMYDDAHLIRALEIERNPAGIIRTEFDGWLKHNRGDLEAAKIATFNDGPGGDKSVFVNYTGLARLHSGAIWQMYTALNRFVAEVEEKSGSRFEFRKEKRWLT